ncbi:MAG: hypothetical protein ACK52V_01050 [Betaproteobacteria bacterium]
MSEPVTDPLRDPQLEAAYRAGSAELPLPRLDERIRAAARREAGSGPRALGVPPRWRAPFAMAAVLVLSLGLVLILRDQGADRLDGPPLASTETTPRPAAADPVPAAPPAAASASPSAPQEEKASSQRKAPLPPAPVAAAETPAAAPARIESAAVAAPAAEGRSPEAAAPAPRALMRAPAAPAADVARAASVAAVPPWQDLQDKPAEQWRLRILELWRAQRVAEAEALEAEFRKRFPEERLPEWKQP